jgi:hypothetical protein
MRQLWLRKWHKGFWQGSPKEIDHTEDLGVLRKTILNMILKKEDRRVWNGLIRIRIG